jgi:hypothetical protein
MCQRYIARRDLDGWWSVRDAATNHPVFFRGASLVGKTERVAVLRARNLNGAGEQLVDASPPAKK